MKARVPCVALLVTTSALLSCTMLPVTRAPSSDSWAERTLPEADGGFPHRPAHPDQLEALLLEGNFVLKSTAGAGAGTTGAKKIEVRFPDADLIVQLKWKRMDGEWKPFWGRLDGINNSPRKEIAAWKIQQLFLDPEDYVIPVSVAFAQHVEKTTDKEAPTLGDTRCVLGVLSVWLKDVTVPEVVLDPERFNRDYTYAYHLANLNLATYLMKHHDGRPGNLMVSKDDARRQVFAVDNGVAFGGMFYNWFVPNWNDIRVPALRRESIDRLRALREEDVEKLLGVIAQLELDDEGVYRNVPLGENLDDDDGVRFEGKILQLGLTDDEVEDVWERIEDLIEDVDKGDIAVF